MPPIASPSALSDGATARAGTRFGDIRWFDEVASTNAIALAQATMGTSEGLVVVAVSQSQGRGRLGRRWEAPPGSALLGSILLRPKLPGEALHFLTMAMGVAIVEAIEALVGVSARLKWPNDVIVSDMPGGPERKLAGILAESSPASSSAPVLGVMRIDNASSLHREGVDEGEARAVVIGFGINLSWDAPPHGLEDIAITLGACAGREVSRAELLGAVLDALEPILTGIDTPQGRGALLERYRSLSATLGRRVRVDLGEAAIEGMAIEIAAGGELLVEPDSGTPISIFAGDVVHLRYH